MIEADAVYVGKREQRLAREATMPRNKQAQALAIKLSRERTGAPDRAKGFDHTTQGAYAVAASVAKSLGFVQRAQRTGWP
jgi:hypothetical protein